MGGEALQRLSNGCLYAVKHKVGLTGHKSRHSLAFFLDPRPDALLEPIDGVCSNRKKKMYKVKTIQKSYEMTIFVVRLGVFCIE